MPRVVPARGTASHAVEASEGAVLGTFRRDGWAIRVIPTNDNESVTGDRCRRTMADPPRAILALATVASCAPSAPPIRSIRTATTPLSGLRTPRAELVPNVPQPRIHSQADHERASKIRSSLSAGALRGFTKSECHSSLARARTQMSWPA